MVRKIDFDNLDDHSNAFADADIAFSCLGTTRAKSGAEGFVKVDFDYIVNTAKMLKDHGRCKDFHLVSSTGNHLLLCIYDSNPASIHELNIFAYVI